MRTTRRMLMARHGLPSAYERLEYIENTSTAYITIPNLPIGGVSMKVETKLLVTAYKSDCAMFQMYVGKDDNNTEVNISGLQIGWGGGSFVTKEGKAGIQINKPTPKYGVDYIFEYTREGDTNKTTLNDEEIVKGRHYYGDSTLIQDYDGKTIFDLFLFNIASLSRTSLARFYDFKYSADGIKYVSLIPAKRKSDGTIGMYDLVGRKFYTSPNGVAFSGGGKS